MGSEWHAHAVVAFLENGEITTEEQLLTSFIHCVAEWLPEEWAGQIINQWYYMIASDDEHLCAFYWLIVLQCTNSYISEITYLYICDSSDLLVDLSKLKTCIETEQCPEVLMAEVTSMVPGEAFLLSFVSCPLVLEVPNDGKCSPGRTSHKPSWKVTTLPRSFWYSMWYDRQPVVIGRCHCVSCVQRKNV